VYRIMGGEWGRRERDVQDEEAGRTIKSEEGTLLQFTITDPQTK
jgi:hypothetical protein